MILRMVSEADGKTLDTITVTKGKATYVTGAAKPVVRLLAGRVGSKKKALKALADGGWSNGYVTVKPE